MGKETLVCPLCKVLMDDYMVPMDVTGKLYPAKKCPKCNRIMVHEATGRNMAEDLHKEGDVNQAWVDMVMARADATEKWPTNDPLDSYRQLLHYRVRMASRFLLKSDKNCPRCGRTNLRVIQERKIGKDLCCDDCDMQYFYYSENP